MTKKVFFHNLLIVVSVTLFFVTLPNTSFSSPIECPKGGTAKIVSIEGSVEALRAHETDWHTVKINDTFCPEDKIRTAERSRALLLLLQNDTTLRLDQKSTIKFSAVDPKNPTLLDLITGSGLFMSRFSRRLTINTPFVNASSEGTEFLIEVNEEGKSTTLTVLEGRMLLANEAGSLLVKSGQSAVTKANASPILRLLVRPKDAIQWTLYYPPVVSLQGVRFEDLSEDNPRRYTYLASQLLAVGRVEEAKAEIEKAIRLSPGSGDALSLQAIIAVVQNEKEKALQLAKEAVQADPSAVSPKIALSYAYQAHFDLPNALKVLQDAVALEPENTLALARLAELWMAEGNRDKALDAAKKAVAINPNEARAQTILGFSYLTEIRTADAKIAFEKAIDLDQSDPLPRLGLGLATIREGNLTEGRRQIEIAVSLNPENGLIRSYLGKGYYEENRNRLAEIQLELAKEQDPNDPTPWLYDAIRKQTENRPVEALHDLQKSIALNDNRAVYRSRLLLDEDLATRGTSLARIYRDLGFEQIALVEGWKSIDTDPASYSAHRFLADSYAALPNSEIARVSELLVSQLLQPLNSNPVQPQLGEKGSALLSEAGPVNPSFGEFNQLFIRDGVKLLVSGITDINSKNNLSGEEVILSGLQGRYAFSIGQLHYKTDGFRENNDQEQTLYNGFFQVALTHRTRIQADVRSERT